MRRDPQPQTGLTGIALMAVSIDTQLSNVLGSTMLAQARSLRAHPESVLQGIWKMLSLITGGTEGNLLIKAVSGADLSDDEKLKLLTAGRSLVGDQVDYADHRKTWIKWAATYCPSLSTSNSVWGPLWPTDTALVTATLPWSKNWTKYGITVESPCSSASRELAGWVYTRDAAALGVHLVPPELKTEKGFTQKPKWLEDKAVLIPLGRNFGGYGSLLFFQLARLQLEFIEPLRTLIASHPSSQGVRNFKIANEAYTDALNDIRKKVPLVPQLSFIASAWQKAISLQTQDGLLPATLLPHYNGSPTAAIVAERSSASKAMAVVSMTGMRQMANSIVKAFYTPDESMPEWGGEKASSPVDVFTLQHWIASLSPFAETWPSMAGNFQYGNIDATPGVIHLTGADYALSDMDAWEGSLVNAILGYTPMIGVQNRKVLGKERRNADNFGISGAKDEIKPGIPLYYIPLPGAPIADSHADGLRLRYLPASATAEEGNHSSEFIDSSTVEMHKIVADLWTDEKRPVLRQYYSDPYSAKEWSLPTDKPTPPSNAVQSTSWDPYVIGTKKNIEDAVTGAFPPNKLDHVMHRPEGFNYRVPVRISRSYAVQILDTSLAVMARTYTQEGYVSFTDDELNFSTEGMAAVTALVQMVPNHQTAFDKSAEERPKQ